LNYRLHNQLECHLSKMHLPQYIRQTILFPLKIKLVADKNRCIGKILNGTGHVTGKIMLKAIQHDNDVFIITRLPVNIMFWSEGIIKFCSCISYSFATIGFVLTTIGTIDNKIASNIICIIYD